MKTYSPSALEQAVRAWVVAALSITVVYADQRDAPRPAVPYASVKVVARHRGGSMPERSYETPSPDDGTATEQLLTRRVATVSVSIFGDGHQARAEALEDSTSSLDIADANNANGIVIVGAIAGPLTIGIASGSVPDARSVIDFEVRHTSTRTQTGVAVIDDVSLTFNGEALP